MIVAVLAVLAAALLISEAGERREVSVYLTAAAKEHGVLLDRALELEGDSLATFVKDCSLWGEVVQFVQAGDRIWASVDLDEGIDTYQACAAWVLDAAGASVGAVRDPALEAMLEPLPPGRAVKGQFGDSRFRHFFTARPDGPAEIAA